MRKVLVALVAAIIIGAPLAARAQIVDQQQPYDQQQAPSYSEQGNDGEAQIHGRILSFDGAYSVQVRDEKGYVDQIQLHQGTIINPTGLTLAPGMVVSIMGYNAGSFFAANQIDTPYTFDGGSPYYNGHPWSYYGPSVSLGFFFGNVGWWHGASFGAPYRWNGGVRYYNNVHVSTFYRGGSYSGRNYVAPRANGGYYAPQNERRYPSNRNGGSHDNGGNNGGGYRGESRGNGGSGNGGERHDGGRRDGGGEHTHR